VEIPGIEKNREYKTEIRMSDEDPDKNSRLLSGAQELTLEFCCLTACSGQVSSSQPDRHRYNRRCGSYVPL